MAIVNHPPTTAVDTQNMTGELMPPSEGWRNFFQQVYAVCNSVSTWGASILRPNAFLFPGRFFFDTSLGSDGEPIWRNKDNTGWVGLAGGGGGTGTVTSVALGAPDIFTVSGSPVTTSGTLAFTPTDPNADRIVFWDDSAGKWVYLTVGAGLAITGTTLDATGGGTGTVTNVAFSSVNDDTATVSGSPVTTTGTLTLTAVDAGVDKLVGWDDSAGKKIYFTLGAGLSTTGTTLNVVAGAGSVTDVALAVVNDDTVTVSGSPVTTTGTLTETAVDAGADKLVFWDDSAGKKVYATIGSGLVMSGTTLSATGGGGTAVRWPHFQWNGTPPSLECLLRAVFPADVTFLDDFAGSVGVARNAATSATVFDVQKNGSTVGSINWAAFASVPTFTSSGPVTFLGAGGGPDVLEVYAPTIPDGTLGNFTVTLAGAP